jgi:hypothetical protein
VRNHLEFKTKGKRNEQQCQKGHKKRGGTRTQSSLILASLKNSHFYFGVFVRSVCDDRDFTHPQKAKFENNFVVFFFFFLKKCPPIDE